jgi:small neutral amino acid transporter SnatA (MarC family)
VAACAINTVATPTSKGTNRLTMMAEITPVATPTVRSNTSVGTIAAIATGSASTERVVVSRTILVTTATAARIKRFTSWTRKSRPRLERRR